MEEIVRVEETAPVEARIASATATSHAAGEEIETRSAADPVDPEVITATVPGPAAVAAPRAWDPGAAVDLEAGAAAVAAGVAGSSAICEAAEISRTMT